MAQPHATTPGGDRLPDQPARTSVKILVPGNHLMVGLLGQRDELLRLVEAAFPVEILVRGNEITFTVGNTKYSGTVSADGKSIKGSNWSATR